MLRRSSSQFCTGPLPWKRPKQSQLRSFESSLAYDWQKRLEKHPCDLLLRIIFWVYRVSLEAHTQCIYLSILAAYNGSSRIAYAPCPSPALAVSDYNNHWQTVRWRQFR